MPEDTQQFDLQESPEAAPPGLIPRHLGLGVQDLGVVTTLGLRHRAWANYDLEAVRARDGFGLDSQFGFRQWDFGTSDSRPAADWESANGDLDLAVRLGGMYESE